MSNEELKGTDSGVARGIVLCLVVIGGLALLYLAPFILFFLFADGVELG